jgi:hypothetical protein
LNGALTDVVLRGEGLSEEVNLVGVCGGLFTDRGASRFSLLASPAMMHGNYVYFGRDWIGFVWFGSVEFSLL